MKKTLVLFLFLGLTIPAWGATYYYICPTTMTNRADDPVQVFIKAHYPRKTCKIFFGDKKAVVAINTINKAAVTDINISEKTSEEVQTMTDKELINAGFKAEEFVIASREAK